MKAMLHLLALSILVISISGCGQKHVCPVAKNIVKIEYIKRPLPDLEIKPEAVQTNPIMMSIDGSDYYVWSKADGASLRMNWESYKIWAETNYSILLNLKKDDNKTK